MGAVAPANVATLEMKADGRAWRGQPSAAQASLKQPEIPRGELLANFGMYWDLYWLFDDAQREDVLKLSLEDFGGVPPRAPLPLPRQSR